MIRISQAYKQAEQNMCVCVGGGGGIRTATVYANDVIMMTAMFYANDVIGYLTSTYASTIPFIESLNQQFADSDPI